MKPARYRMVSIVAILLSLSGSPSRAATIPDWYFQAPSHDSRLTGTGSGGTVEEARQVALASILLQVSQQVQARTESSLGNLDGEVKTSFRQIAQGESLVMDIGSSEISREFRDPDSGTVYLQVAVDKADLARDLSGQLNRVSVLRFPESAAPVEQLLWSLQYMDSLDLGLRLERALDGLGESKPALRRELEANRQKALKRWQNAGVKIIAKHSLGAIASRLGERLPVSTNTLLWLQLDLQKYTRRTQSGFEQRQILTVDLKQPQSPFTSFIRTELAGSGRGSSKNSAAQAAEHSLYQKLNQPLASWLF